VPVANVIDEAVDLAKPIAAGQQIDLQVSTPGQPLWAVADAGRLKQVVLNLLSNALKYNRPGGKATVSWGIDAQGSPEISVSDTGFGIAPEKLARLFQPFDRLGAEATGIEGTGLGLALSKGLVEAMGGNIAARSTPGLGSTFTVTLPPAEDPAQAPIAEPASPNGHVAAFGQRTILYVEDNLANLRLMERVISRYPSLRLVPAMQGRLALELVRTADPDLILLDLNLPDMPGEAVLEEVLREPGQRRVPIIVISAEASPRHVQRLVDSGADAYITKPIDVSHVIGLLEEFLGPTSAPYRRDQQRSNEAGPHSPGG
jgi:CheY-like chemotaxis protein/anti-sigma regulatory factor (Ser/Thr protein kinase)